MNTTSSCLSSLRRGCGSAFFASWSLWQRRAARSCAVACAVVAMGATARAEMLVLRSGSGERHVVRFDETTGGQLGTFGHETEAYYTMTLTPFNEICVSSNVLGSHSLQRFTCDGEYLGDIAGSWLGGVHSGTRGADGRVY